MLVYFSAQCHSDAYRHSSSRTFITRLGNKKWYTRDTEWILIVSPCLPLRRFTLPNHYRFIALPFVFVSNSSVSFYNCCIAAFFVGFFILLKFGDFYTIFCGVCRKRLNAWRIRLSTLLAFLSITVIFAPSCSRSFRSLLFFCYYQVLFRSLAF